MQTAQLGSALFGKVDPTLEEDPITDMACSLLGRHNRSVFSTSSFKYRFQILFAESRFADRGDRSLAGRSTGRCNQAQRHEQSTDDKAGMVSVHKSCRLLAENRWTRVSQQVDHDLRDLFDNRTTLSVQRNPQFRVRFGVDRGVARTL